MSIEKLIKDLNTKKGYISNGKLKKGKLWLANHYGVTLESIEQALAAIRVVKTAESLGLVTPTISAVNPVIKGEGKTFWVAGCMHMPFHNKKQLSATLRYLKTIDLDGIILAGDILDINSLSFHDKGKVPLDGVTLSWEYEESLKAMKPINQLIKDKGISSENLHFMYGNHEDRYLRTLRQIDQSKYGKALLAPEDALKLSEQGWNIYRDYKRDFITLGDLVINHGEYLNQHVAKKTIEVYKQSALFFHTHRFQIYADGPFVGYNMGFMGDVNSPVFNYAPRGWKQAWANASALVTVIDGKAYVQPLLFKNNKLVLNGKEI